MIARVAAVASLAGAVVLVVLILFGGGPSYTLPRRLPGRRRPGHRQPRDDRPGQGRLGAVDRPVAQRPGPGEVQRRLGAARCTRARSRGSTRTRCRGSPTSYVVLEPGPADAPQIHDGGRSPRTTRTRSSASTSCSTRSTPRRDRACAASSRARPRASPARRRRPTRRSSTSRRRCASTSDVTAELARNEPRVRRPAGPGRAGDADARRRAPTQLTAAGGEHERDDRGDRQPEPEPRAGAAQLGPTLTHSTATFAGLRSTLDVLAAAGRQVDSRLPPPDPVRPAAAAS